MAMTACKFARFARLFDRVQPVSVAFSECASTILRRRFGKYVTWDIYKKETGIMIVTPDFPLATLLKTI